MKKYDCSKTLDYKHELNRVCKMYEQCYLGCPMRIQDNSCVGISEITQESIDRLQKWSDENPEEPKLSMRDRAFLEAFDGYYGGRVIHKDSRGFVFYVCDGVVSTLTKGMFEDMASDTEMTFEELLEMDTEEEE